MISMSSFVDQDKPRRYLIAIGSPDCPGLKLPSLPNVESDIEKIVQLFTHSQQGYERVLADHIPLGARSDEIKNALSKWFASSDRTTSDCVIIYYAGHGDDGYGETGLAGDHYLFTVDSRSNNLSNTAISTRSLIGSLFQGINDYPKNVLLILDICYAGIGQRQAFDVLSKLRNLNSGGSGFWIMASSTDTQAGDGAFVTALEKVMQFEHEQGREFLELGDLTHSINQHFEEEKRSQRVSLTLTELQRQASFICNPRFVQSQDIVPVSHYSSPSTPPIKYDKLMNENIATAKDIELTTVFKATVDDLEMQFAHRNREKVSFDDLFVFPDLKNLKESLEDLSTQIKGEKLWEYSNRMLIFGTDLSGKTTLAKKLFFEALENNFLPLPLNGSSIKTSKLEDLVHKSIRNTYSSISPEEFLQQRNIVCIVDDLPAISLNRKSTNKFIENLNLTFTRIILFADESYKLVAPDFSSLDDYQQLEILPFNNVRRNRLVEKWVSLDSNEETDDQQILAKEDELRVYVNSIVGKNVVPANPFYILLILQAFETVTVQRLELTEYGHCYQYLIYQALIRVHVKLNEFDTYFNLLSELAKAVQDSTSECLDESELDAFFEQYCRNFIIDDRDKVVRNLVKASILERSKLGLKFRYRYLFYFFLAKKLAESLHQGEEAKQIIERLVSTIHLETSSNIILFLTHHSKDQWILDEILMCIMEIFSEEQQMTLESSSLSFLQDFVKEIPDIVMETRDAREERLREATALDRLEEKYEDQESEIHEDNPSDVVVKVNKLFRSIEVSGQILRNRIGSLERGSLEEIYEESLSVSLRFLNLFLRYSEAVKEEAIRKIKKTIVQKPNLSDSRITKEVESFYLTMNYAVILGMLYKTANSLGSPRGRDIYTKVTESRKDPASILVQAIIELQFGKNIDKIEKLHDSFDKNPICNRFLKHIVVAHLYKHDVGYKDRQRLANKLGISMQLQRSLQFPQSESNSQD